LSVKVRIQHMLATYQSAFGISFLILFGILHVAFQYYTNIFDSSVYFFNFRDLQRRHFIVSAGFNYFTLYEAMLTNEKVLQSNWNGAIGCPKVVTKIDSNFFDRSNGQLLSNHSLRKKSCCFFKNVGDAY